MKGTDKGQIAGVQAKKAPVMETAEIYQHRGQSCQKLSLNMPNKREKMPWE